MLISAGALSATAQTTDKMPAKISSSHDDGHLPRWVVDVNVLGGALTQKLAMENSAGNYLNGVNVNQGSLRRANGSSFGFDAQGGYFFGKKRHWGVGTGVMYLGQAATVQLDNFHVEFRATDASGNIYRQVVTPNQPIQEKLKISNFNIPLVLKYKNRLSEQWGFTADAGVLWNFQMKNSYTANASFDYEAIYKYSANPGGVPTVYDNSPTPNTTDFLITKAGYLATDHNGNVGAFFTQQAGLGRNVGLNVKPKTNTGTVSYRAGGSGGLFLQPSVNYFLSDNVALNFGAYYLYQWPGNNAKSGYTLTKNMGEYSSVLNNVSRSWDQSYGLNVGVRVFIGKTRKTLSITQEAINPTNCGLTDGAIVLHGLPPAERVMVSYNLNGSVRPAYGSMTDANGNIRLTELGPGDYSEILVIDGRDKAIGAPVTLVNPVLTIASVRSLNTTHHDKCDGTITLTGLNKNKYVTLDYDFNGVPQPPNNEMVQMVGEDGTVTIRHLCPGVYTHIAAKMNSCIAHTTDVTITAPAAPPPPPSVYETIDTSKLSSSIYFDPGKKTITKATRPTVEYAAQKMIEHKEAYIVVNGYADNSGKADKNMELSVNRAEAVRDELIKMGVSASQIRVEGKGTNDPIGDNKTAAGRAKNRRAVLTLDIITMEQHRR